MKKIVFAIALLLTLGFSASAQRDGFFHDDGGGYESRGDAVFGVDIMLPDYGVGAYNGDQPATAPIGSGLLVLTALGAVYLVRKKR